jgi:hypothetical protein
MIAVVFGLALVQAQRAHAADCAFLDLNNNGTQDAGDVTVLDSEWLNGIAYTTTEPFVVPAGCNKLFSSGIVTTNGVKVTAPKITFNGLLHLARPGGQGIQLVATGPEGFISNGGSLKSGGVNPTFAPNKKRAVMIVAETGPCTFSSAVLEGITPTAGTNVGVKCEGDVRFSNTKVIGALVNIRSVAGKIDAAANPADICDVGGGVPSLIQSGNDPVILLAFGDLILDGSEVVGKYRVLGVSETGDISTKNSSIHNGSGAPGGAHIAMFPSPSSVTFTPVDFEDVRGPSSGTLDITDACYQSPQRPRLGQGALLVGVPDPPPCAQPADFVLVLNAIY